MTAAERQRRRRARLKPPQALPDAGEAFAALQAAVAALDRREAAARIEEVTRWALLARRRI